MSNVEKDLFSEMVFFNEVCDNYRQITLFKALELVMSESVPPPYYLGADIYEGVMIIVAIPEYDFDLICESLEKEGFLEAAGGRDNLMWFMPAHLLRSGVAKAPSKKTTSVMGGLLFGRRVFVSTSNMADFESVDIN